MSKSTMTLNNNFKVCARIKPLEYSSRMLEVNGENTVTIRDINNKTNMEKQNFRFNKVFDAFSKQDNIFQYVVDNGISKALDGTNCCVISYGQTGAGKTFTTFGEDDKYSTNTINLYSDTQKDKRGIIPKTIEYLLNKNQEMAGVRELILTCNFVEIYLDQVRDISRNHIDRNQLSSATKRNSTTTTTMDFNTASYDNESLEIYEHANGQMLIRNVKNVIIKSMDELYSLLGSGFKIREKAESKGNQIWARAHTIFTINIVQKEVENEDLPFPKSMIQFVDLAGSERIAKSITEGQHKFQEAVLIMSHLTSLYKVLAAIAVNSKNIPYRDSKLTKLLSNCLNPYNNIIMIAHLHPAESNFEETLNTLQYAERCKNIDFKEKKMGAMAGAAAGGGVQSSGHIEESGMFGTASTVNNDKMWKKMNDEIAELKNKLETFQKDHKTKLERIQMYLGLEIDLERISANPLSKEAQVLTNMKNVHLENQNLKIAVAQSDEQIAMMRREVDEDRKDFYSKQNKTESKLVEVREQIKRDTEKFKTDKNKDEEALRKQINQLTQENKKLLQHNTQLLDEKTHAIMNFNANLNVMEMM